MLRVCTKCKIEKPEEDFYKRSKGIISQCKECCKIRNKKEYNRNIQHYKIYIKKRNEETKTRNIHFVLEYLQQHPCVDCGETNPLVLEFDHRDPKTKITDVSKMIHRRSTKQLKEEVDKCDIRCANCHRIKTAKQFNYLMYQLVAIF